MGRDVVRYSIGIPRKTYEEIQEMADEKGIPKSIMFEKASSLLGVSWKDKGEDNDK